MQVSCANAACQSRISAKLVFCQRCWRRLPADLQQEVVAAINSDTRGIEMLAELMDVAKRCSAFLLTQCEGE